MQWSPREVSDPMFMLETKNVLWCRRIIQILEGYSPTATSGVHCKSLAWIGACGTDDPLARECPIRLMLRSGLRVSVWV